MIANTSWRGGGDRWKLVAAVAVALGLCGVPGGRVEAGAPNVDKLLGGRLDSNGPIEVKHGDRLDYEDWKAAGNPGWGWDDVLPHFKRKKGEDILPDKIPVYHCKVERDDAIGKRGGIRMPADDPAGKGVRVG